MTQTFDYDPAEALADPVSQAEYLSLAMAEGDPAAIRRSLAVISRAQALAAGGAEVITALPDADAEISLRAALDALRSLRLRLTVVPATVPVPEPTE